MENSALISETIKCLKECFHWRNDKTATIADKIFLSQYVDYVKQHLIEKNEKAKTGFNEFERDYSNLKLEGRLEGFLEIGMEDNTSIFVDLRKKNAEILEYSKAKSQISRGEEVTVEVKPKIQDTPTEKIEEVKDEAPKIVDEEEIFNADFEEKEGEQFEEVEPEQSVEVKTGPILVPWDFSEVANYALQHAVIFAKKIGNELILIHIAKKEKEITNLTQNFNVLVEEINQNYGIKPSFIIREGNIFSTITEIADTMSARLVVMGTHGIKGMQKLTGSYALKVIAGTNAPFLVVQAPPMADTIETALFPIDHTKECRQKLKQAKELTKYFKVKFKVCKQARITNNQYLKFTTTNISYVKSYFSQNFIDYEIVSLDCTDLMDGLIKYAAQTKPEFIMIVTTKNLSLGEYMLGAEEQKIIANESKVPVFCVNPMKPKFKSFGGFGMGG